MKDATKDCLSVLFRPPILQNTQNAWIDSRTWTNVPCKFCILAPQQTFSYVWTWLRLKYWQDYGKLEGVHLLLFDRNAKHLPTLLYIIAVRSISCFPRLRAKQVPSSSLRHQRIFMNNASLRRLCSFEEKTRRASMFYYGNKNVWVQIPLFMTGPNL